MSAHSLNMRILLLPFLLLLPAFAHAERPPLKPYTVADGLPNKVINKIWCGTMRHLYRLERGGNTFKLVPVELGAKEIFIVDLLEDGSGSLWIGSFNGLYRYSEGGFEHYTTDEGLPDNTIHDLLKDHEG